MLNTHLRNQYFTFEFEEMLGNPPCSNVNLFLLSDFI